MKKNLLKFALLCVLGASFGMLTGCGPEEEEAPNNENTETPGGNPGGTTDTEKPDETLADFALELKSVGSDFVEFAVEAAKEVEIAYDVVEKPTLFSPAVLYRTGEKATVKNGSVLKLTENIVQNTSYIIYAVAKLDEENFSDIVEVEFKTSEYQFEELLTHVESYPDGYKVHITVPESAKEAGHVIRYGATSLAWYNLMKSSKNGDAVDLQAVVANGNPYGNFVKNDSTIVMNDNNVVLLDKNGVPVLDSDGQQIDIHDPIAPGEPTIFFAGECRWGTPDEYAAIMGFHLPEKSSYSIPLYDYENGWTGAFQKIIFNSQDPELSDATVKVTIPEDEISVTDAMIYFDADPGVSRYFYMVLDNATYNQVLDIYLDGNEDWFQWFLTSYIAFYEWGVFPETESYTFINAAANFNDGVLIGGDTYHVLCTAMEDETGTKQSFVHETFKAKEKTKRAPVIEVSAAEGKDPYTATFTVKAPNKDVAGAYWACNYSREFELMSNAGYTYADILKGNYTFTTDEIAAINSDAGYTISFPTLDGEKTRLAVYGCNDEYTFNNIDEEVSGAGWADYQAPMCEKKTPVSSSLFTELEGDWTATATVIAKETLEDGSVVPYNHTHSSKVTISSSAPELPSAVEDYVYGLYKNNSKDDVDGMFEELGYLTDQFTEYRLEGQNRLLCNGFIDFDYYKDPGRLTYRTPYELFTAPDYSSVDVPQLIYDFGPKWFLEVLEDGSVIVPFNSVYLPPMHNWPGYPFYVGGLGGNLAFYDATDAIPGFPVEISDDKNTIIVKPIVIEGTSYYMNALGVNSQASAGELEIVATIISEIVLTRGWDEPEETPETVSAIKTSAKAVNMDGTAVGELPKAVVYKSMTKLEPAPKKQYKLDETPNIVTMEMVNEVSEKILKHYNLY